MRRHRGRLRAGGNIALGYSVSSDSVFPGIRYSGRLAGDPIGTMTLPEVTIADPGAAVDVTLDVERALGRLSTPQREAVVLRYFAHLSEADMARILGIAPGTVKSRLARALEALAGDPALSDSNDGGRA